MVDGNYMIEAFSYFVNRQKLTPSNPKLTQIGWNGRPVTLSLLGTYAPSKYVSDKHTSRTVYSVALRTILWLLADSVRS